MASLVYLSLYTTLRRVALLAGGLLSSNAAGAEAVVADCPPLFALDPPPLFALEPLPLFALEPRR